MRKKDVKNVKALFIASIIRTESLRERERSKRRSKHNPQAISVHLIQNKLNISKPTAIKYIKLAKEHEYIDIIPNLRQVKNLTRTDVYSIRKSDLENIEVKLFGSSEYLNVSVNQLRVDKEHVKVQLANMFLSNVPLKKR